MLLKYRNTFYIKVATYSNFYWMRNKNITINIHGACQIKIEFDSTAFCSVYVELSLAYYQYRVHPNFVCSDWVLVFF